MFLLYSLSSSLALFLSLPFLILLFPLSPFLRSFYPFHPLYPYLSLSFLLFNPFCFIYPYLYSLPLPFLPFSYALLSLYLMLSLSRPSHACHSFLPPFFPLPPSCFSSEHFFSPSLSYLPLSFLKLTSRCITRHQRQGVEGTHTRTRTHTLCLPTCIINGG